MRDVFYLDSLGRDVSPFAPRLNMLGKQNFLNICLPIYYTGVRKTRQASKDGYLYSSLERCVLNTVVTVARLYLPMLPVYFSFCD
jgi:hypothetical protein